MPGDSPAWCSGTAHASSTIPRVLSFRQMTLAAIVGVNKAVIGMVHLRALPGSPRWAGSMEAVVQAKHGMPLAPIPLEQEARDCLSRGLADGLVVSGAATGEPTPMNDLKRVRGAVPHVPLLVGSGATPETAAALLSIADGLIVGT